MLLFNTALPAVTVVVFPNFCELVIYFTTFYFLLLFFCILHSDLITKKLNNIFKGEDNSFEKLTKGNIFKNPSKNTIMMLDVDKQNCIFKNVEAQCRLYQTGSSIMNAVHDSNKQHTQLIMTNSGRGVMKLTRIRLSNHCPLVCVHVEIPVPHDQPQKVMVSAHYHWSG
uniref:Uncharacterized protein n=1 Tax=Glossina palpalis gambiensis TaxID=67801 RepID=A0A1B0AT81_9MUSC